MQPNLVVPQGLPAPVHLISCPIESGVNPVGTGIEEFAGAGKIAITCMSAKYASRRDTLATSVHREKALHQVLDSRVKRPSWVQGLMWTDIDLRISRPTLWTKSASPLPPVPLEAFSTTLSFLRLSPLSAFPALRSFSWVIQTNLLSTQ